MSWIDPGDVHSPKNEWTLIAVLRDGGAGNGALCVGRWGGKPVLGMRWNGSDTRPVGNPQSRGLPVWFVVPDEYVDGLLRYGGLHIDQVQMVHAVFQSKILEAFQGDIVKMRDTEHEYQIKEISRSTYFRDRVYQVVLGQMLTLSQYDENNPLSNPAAQPVSEAKFRIRFPMGYRRQDTLFSGTEESADGKEILARLPILLSALQRGDERLRPGRDGFIDITV